MYIEDKSLDIFCYNMKILKKRVYGVGEEMVWGEVGKVKRRNFEGDLVWWRFERSLKEENRIVVRFLKILGGFLDRVFGEFDWKFNLDCINVFRSSQFFQVSFGT
jgi:hypothetical protein